MRLAILGFLLAGLGTVQSFAQTTHDPDIESKIVALENVANMQAYHAQDIITLYAILDDAFVEVDQEGCPRTKAGLLAYVQNADSLQYALKAIVVRLHGDTAIVTGLYTVKGVAGGKPFLQPGRALRGYLAAEEWPVGCHRKSVDAQRVTRPQRGFALLVDLLMIGSELRITYANHEHFVYPCLRGVPVSSRTRRGREHCHNDSCAGARVGGRTVAEQQSPLNLIFDNALVYVEYGQLVTKGDYLARVKQEAPQIAMEAMTVRQFGNTAIVIGAYREWQAKSGQRELRRWRFIDTCVRKKEGWVLVAAAAAPVSR